MISAIRAVPTWAKRPEHAGAWAAAVACAWRMVWFKAHSAAQVALLFTALLASLSSPVAAQVERQRFDLRLEIGNHAGIVRRLAVSPDQQRLLTVGDDKTARLWALKERALLHVLRVPLGDGSAGQLYGAAFSPDGRRVAVGGSLGGTAGGSRMYLFNVADGRASGSIPIPAGEVRRLLWLRGDVLAACQTEPGGLVIAQPDGKVLLRQSFEAACFALAEQADGSLWAAASDGKLRRFVATGGGAWRADRVLDLELRDPRSIAISPDGKYLAVGYFSPLSRGRALVQVFDASTGQSINRLVFDDVFEGNLAALAWSADGTTLAAAGRATQPNSRRFLFKRIAWPAGSVRTDVVASDTINDIAPLGTADFVIATSEPAWAVVPAGSAPVSLVAQLPDLRGASSLRVGTSGLMVGVGGAPSAALPGMDGRRPSVQRLFDLTSRALTVGGADLGGAVHQAGNFAWSNVENRFRPRLNGRELVLGEGEIARAAVVGPNGDGGYLGSSQRLRRYNPDGTERWAARTPTEVTSVGINASGTLLVATLIDGTVSWYRPEDGRLLMSLFIAPDERWVVWTPDGYYDASVGAESLVGWTVSRRDGADFHSIGRFRDRFLRPDVIDRVLIARDTGSALAQANAALRQVAARSDDSEFKAQVDVVAVPAPALQRVFPPTLILAGERGLRSNSPDLKLTFAVRSLGAPADRIVVRIDGRPATPVTASLPSRQDGETLGSLVVRMPSRDAEVTLSVAAGLLLSDPVVVSYRFEVPPVPPARTSAPVAPTALLPSPVLIAPTPAIQSLPEAPPVPPAVIKPPGGRLFVLAVGISDYASPEIDDLRLSAKDASDFAAAMREQVGRPYDSVEVRLLTDGQATRSQVIEGLVWLRTQVGPGDTGMLFLAGHGVNDATGQYHFIAHDTSLNRLSRSSIGEAAIRQALVQMRGRAILFADTCRSGNVIGKSAAMNSDVSRLANSLSSPESGVVVLSASTGRQEALENDSWGNGAFTRALLEGFRGGADYQRDGRITHLALGYFVGQAVRKLTGGRQTPVYAVPLGVIDYVLAAAR